MSHVPPPLDLGSEPVHVPQLRSSAVLHGSTTTEWNAALAPNLRNLFHLSVALDWAKAAERLTPTCAPNGACPVVFLVTSKFSVVILGNFAVLCTLLLGRAAKALFLGRLRDQVCEPKGSGPNGCPPYVQPPLAL